MEKLKSSVVALSVGITSAIVYILCLIFVAVFPLGTVITFGNYFVHGIDLSSIATKNITASRSVIGLIIVSLSGAIVGYVFAVIYNWLGEKI